jgi:hypothetical protein
MRLLPDEFLVIAFIVVGLNQQNVDASMKLFDIYIRGFPYAEIREDVICRCVWKKDYHTKCKIENRFIDRQLVAGNHDR